MRQTLLAPLTFVALAVPSFAAEPQPTPATDPTYAALRAARPEKDGLTVQNLVLTRDVIRLRFDTGRFHLLAPVADRTVGAVFIGKGEWELTPATEGERRHLSRVTEDKAFTKLTDSFERVVLLFTDDTAGEILKAGKPAAPASAEGDPAKVFEGYLNMQKKTLANVHLRVLSDVLAGTPPAEGFFMAFVDGKKLPAGLLAVDPRSLEVLGLGDMSGSESVGFHSLGGDYGGLWYSSQTKADLDAGRTAPRPLEVDAVHYDIDTRIERNADIAATTVMHLDVRKPGLRVLHVGLMSKLRIQSAAVSIGQGNPFRDIAVVQEDWKDDATAAVVLPEAPPVGARVAVRVAYKGDRVLENYGEGNYAVGARTSWYANVGNFGDPATFDIRYSVPAGNEVISVGRRVESRPDGGNTLYRFRAEQPIRVAGFNYGRFRKLSRTDAGIELSVYTNPGRPITVDDIEEWIEYLTILEGREAGAVPVKFDTGHLAQAALADGINAARTCAHYFGPLPIQEVSITQQVQWFFGQSWPSLIYLPYLSFLDSTTRVQLGLMSVMDFVDEVGPHEMAHQWWGHHIGWGTYRDPWLSEGFAEFSAVLVSQQTHGMKKYVDYFANAQKHLFKRWPGNAYANWEVGPISMGYRLPEGERQRGAYSAVVYTKGAYVLHMLRMMMRESGRPKEPGGKPTDPDALFIAMMKDFTSTWAGKEPTTADFQKVVERHMTRPMNLTGDGKMDWFFREWYDGTDIPRYKHSLAVKEEGAGRYRLSGEITQSEVSADFRMLVGLYAEFDKGRTALLARIPVAGNATVPLDVVMPLPEKPKALHLNALKDVLERD
jgi:hypothetical protein